jgi:hypothetical protein
MKNLLRTGLALLGLLAGLAVGGAAQEAVPGFTGCVQETPVAVVREDLQDEPMVVAEILAHESVHIVQLQAIMDSLNVSCVDALTSMNLADPRSNLAVEVPAYRYQAEWLEQTYGNLDRREFYLFVAKALRDYYAGALDVGEILAALYGSESEPYIVEPQPPGVSDGPGEIRSRWHRTDPLTNGVYYQ